MERFNKAKNISNEFINFVNQNVSPYHVTHFCKKSFLEKGYIQLSEIENWNLEKGKNYFFTKNESTIFAFKIGNKFDPLNSGFKIIGGHTDSPVLKLAPFSKHKTQELNQACILTYGGGLWHTWLDRDLTLAGKVVHFDQQSQAYKTSLYHEIRPLIKIPNLAIHLQASNERGKLELNYENHLRPIFCSEIAEKLFNIEQKDQQDKFNILTKHNNNLVNLISKQLKINQSDIVELDLNLCDTQPAQLVGVHEEFISAPRIDNQLSSFLAFKAILDLQTQESSWIDLICLFDHEECGSESAQGADSNILPTTLERIFKVLSKDQKDLPADSYEKMLFRSFQISADMSHAIHPNYQDKHQINHQIKINKGVGVKINVNQNYATDAISSSIIKIITEKRNIPIQEFCVKNDSPCGSTIGRMISAQTGIKTIDIGNPQWSMHSIRETAGVLDTLYCYELFLAFFEEYHNLSMDLLGK